PPTSSQTSSLHSTAAITPFPPISKCSVNSLRQVLSSSGIHFSRRSSKAQLYDLFISSSIPTNTSTAHKSKTRPSSTSVSLPVRRSEPTQSQRADSKAADAATARTSLSAGISTRPTTAAANSSTSSPLLTNFLQSAPLFRQEPNLLTLSTALPSASPVLSNLLYNNPCARSLSQTVTFLSPSNQPTQIADPSVRLPSLAIPPPLPFHSNSPQSFLPPSILQLPPNILPSTHPSVRLPPQRISTPFFPTNPLHLIPAHASHLGHQSVMGPIDQHSSTFFNTNTCSNTIRLPAHSLSTAVHLPAPPNAVAMEPPPVSAHLRSLILSGADIDLPSLLTSVPLNESHCSFDCGPLTINLKNSIQPSKRVLTLAKFCIAFARYTEVICTSFPARRKELNDYLSIIAELSLSFGGSHFYTYHKLFSAKCTACVTHWNQCPYWGALDLELYNRVFLGVQSLSCAICRSIIHSTSECPQTSPDLPTHPAPFQEKSTSHVPQSRNDRNQIFTSVSGRQVCNSFNSSGCNRQRCRFLHVCNFCGGAHARSICPVRCSSANLNKKFQKYLSSPIIISSLARELDNYPDKNFTQFLLSGLKEGFDPGLESIPDSSLICNNLQSAIAEPYIVEALIKKELDSGFMIGPFDFPPFELFRISPIGVATRKFSGKKRMIINLSAPHGNSQPSINSLIPLDEFSLHYHDIDQAITLIKNASFRAWLAKVDITSAFKVMPIHPDFWHLFGIRWNEKYYFAVRLTFGCKSSPKIFDMLSEALCWILQNNYAIPYLIHLLDDFLVISPSNFPPAKHLTVIQTVFSKLGVPLSLEKTEGPSTSLEFLGILLDSVKFQASLPKEKIDCIITIASNLLEANHCSKRDLLSLLGHLNDAIHIIPQGRPFISHLLTLATSAPGLENIISLSQPCRADLKLWITFLKQWNGITFFYNDFLSRPCDITLFTDAAPSTGFGGFYRGRWFASTWPPELTNTPQTDESTALFELYPIVVAAYLWGSEWSTKNILFHCDNSATVHCINKSRSNAPKIMPFLRRLIWISACHQFVIKAEHIPGHQNQIADALSRFLFHKFRTLAPEADSDPTPVPPYSELIFL
ncbi:hypothetical protein PO909_004007, partial [Leuciscus waleckii]